MKFPISHPVEVSFSLICTKILLNENRARPSTWAVYKSPTEELISNQQKFRKRRNNHLKGSNKVITTLIFFSTFSTHGFLR